MDIEDRINKNHQKVAQVFIEDLLKDKIIPDAYSEGVYYLKDEAAPRITERLEKDGVALGTSSYDFSTTLYKSINKMPLKQVGYGLLNVKLPSEIVKELTPWEALYAYAGIWSKKSTDYAPHKFNRMKLQTQTLYQIARDIIIVGIDRIKYIHNREASKGNYKNKIEYVPHEQEILERMHEPRITCANKLPKYSGQLSLF